MTKSEEAQFAYHGLDRVLHEKARLGIVTSLASRPEGLAFADLKLLCALTDGNLSRHLQVLEDDGVVEIVKSFREKRPLTSCRLTKHGRQRFADYITVLERVVRDAAETAKQTGGAHRASLRLKPNSA